MDEKGKISLIKLRGSGKMLKSKRIPIGRVDLSFEIILQFYKGKHKGKDDLLKLDSLLEMFSKKRNISIEN